MRRSARTIALIGAASAATSVLAAGSSATAPPVGPLPAGPSSSIRTTSGELVSFALPHRAGGRVWRIARAVDARVLTQVTEGDVGKSVVLVFKATGRGSATIKFALTRGERAKAYESRTFVVSVR